MKIALLALVSVLALSGCAAASTSPSKPASQEPALRAAVQSYSDAYLTGDAKTAYSLLSARCKKVDTLSGFTELVHEAKGVYGSKLPIQSFKADIAGDLARVTYTYSLKAIDQKNQPWAKESSQWRDDSC